MRKVLFGIKEQSPDVLTEKKRNRVIIYGYLTMIYRFFLFIGIAVLIYYMMPKAIGILLFILFGLITNSGFVGSFMGGTAAIFTDPLIIIAGTCLGEQFFLILDLIKFIFSSFIS